MDFLFDFYNFTLSDNNMWYVFCDSQPANPLSSSPQPSTWRFAYKALSIILIGKQKRIGGSKWQNLEGRGGGSPKEVRWEEPVEQGLLLVKISCVVRWPCRMRQDLLYIYSVCWIELWTCLGESPSLDFEENQLQMWAKSGCKDEKKGEKMSYSSTR